MHAKKGLQPRGSNNFFYFVLKKIKKNIMMSKFWLYLGILLACSGIGTGLGIFLIVLYVWADIKESINNNAVNNMDEENYNPNFYSKETAEEMK